jgi:hypothetical protein
MPSSRGVSVFKNTSHFYFLFFQHCPQGIKAKKGGGGFLEQVLPYTNQMDV